ncbi:MAG: transketolase [Candidatus Dormiibacterota bacterium]
MSAPPADGGDARSPKHRAGRRERTSAGAASRAVLSLQPQPLASLPPGLSKQGSSGRLAVQSAQLRELILDVAYQAHVGHIASCLSIADIITATFAVLDLKRDTFVLSKGHAALTLYAALYQNGLISHEELFSYCAEDSLFAVHPDHRIPGVRFTTGSLGYGLGFAAGVSLAHRAAQAPPRCITVVSDAELNEGSSWEAIMFAGHHRLPLVAIVDVNGQQALGRTRAVLDLAPLAPKFASFGWRAQDVDGHDPYAMRALIKAADASRPCALLAHTVAGRGVPFMEGRVEWHYWPLSEVQHADARRALRTTQP